jgi:CheY-like chemotaxis protein
VFKFPADLADGTFSEVLFMKPFSALLLSADPGSVAITQKILEKYGLTVKVVASAQSAEQLIKTTKFDLGVFDHDLPEALNLVAGRATSANPQMIFALVRGARLNDVRGKRVHFVVQKPFTADLFARSLRAAYGTMIRDRRLGFRHLVRIKPVSCELVQDGGNQALTSSTIMDISQNGMCIQTLEILPQGVTLQIAFQLPESRELIHATGSVMWTRASGRTGIRFIHVSQPEQKNLTAWLDSMLPYETETIPRAAPPSARQARMAELQM